MVYEYERNHTSLEPVETSKISQIYDGKVHNIYCKVLRVYDWILSKGGDYVMTLIVTDVSEKKIFLKIFSPDRLLFTFKENDFLYVRNVKLYNNDLFFVQHPISIELVNKENNIRSSKRELCEIQDIDTKKYIDIAGILIHKQRESNNLVIVDIMDFTKNIRINGNLNRGKYTNDMILHVKLWDAHCAIYDQIVIGAVYKMENLNVKIQDNIMYGNLSDQGNCRIYKLEDTEIINKINRRKEEYNKYTSHLYEDIFSTFEEIRKEGFYRVNIVVERHFPSNGYEIEICKKCKCVITNKNKNCACAQNHITKILILKLLVRDESKEAIILCKNNLCSQALKKIRNNTNLWKCLIYASIMGDKIVFELREFLFD